MILIMCFVDCSHSCYIYLLKHKEVTDGIKNFSYMIVKPFEKNIKILRNDNARSFCNIDLHISSLNPHLNKMDWQKGE